MPSEICKTLCKPFSISFLDFVYRNSSVHLQALGCRHYHGQGRAQTCLAAFDVIELLRSQVGSETGLGDDIVPEAHRHLRGEHGVAAVCYVGERTAVHEGRSALCGLDQIRMYGIHQQHRDGSSHSHILDLERLVVYGDAQSDVVYPPPEVIQVTREAEYGHDLRCRGDVEAALRHTAVGLGSQSGDDVAQIPVIHVQYPLPEHFLEGEALLLVLVYVIVQQRADHIVCGGHRVEVPGEMEIDLLHRQHLGISAARCATLYSEAWTERRLAQGANGLLAYPVQAQGQTYADRGLAYSGFGRGDGGHEYELTVSDLLFVNEAFGNLGDIPAVMFQA